MHSIFISISQRSIYFGKQCRGIICSLLVICSLLSCATNGKFQQEGDIHPGDVDKLSVVDCLLPGQLRKLGMQMTYMTARRPIRTTAVNCEIRGGEYIAFDRANYETALKTWMPKASEGDAEAQVYVGEIYEKGMGIAPDFSMAAMWYRKAADQGNSTAQTNLGYLYEKGLGVDQDMVSALNWYRKASGLENSDLAFASSIEMSHPDVTKFQQQAAKYKAESEQYQQESAALREKLSFTQQQLENTRRQLESRKLEVLQEREGVNQLRERLQKEKQKTNKGGAVSQSTTPEITRFEQALDKKVAELKLKEQTISRLEKKAQEQEQALEVYMAGAGRTVSEKDRELIALRSELNQQKSNFSKLQAELNQAESRLQQTQQEMREQKQSLQQKEVSLSKLKKKLSDSQQIKTQEEKANRTKLNTELVQLQQALAAQKQALSKLTQEQAELISQDLQKQQALKKQNAEIAALQKRIASENRKSALAKNTADKVSMVGPQIEIIEPPLTVQRGGFLIKTRSGVTTRTIIGKVTAPAGLVSLLINDKEESLDQNNIFKTSVKLESAITPVDIVAVDKNSKRTELKLNIEPQVVLKSVKTVSVQSESIQPKKPILKNMLPRGIFGKYYALVIGNNEYSKLPKLDTAMNDAEVVGGVLKSKYGFETKILLNATRYDILKALNDYRKILTEKDNLLIYYAGHGILDKVNDRGHWLPVDAEPDSSANWISVQNVTDQLKIIAAKHVLVVADSCYSGSLTRSSVARLETGMTTQKRAQWIKLMLEAKSRMALTSGGLEPVLDGGGGNHSVFARAFIDTLNKNNDLMESQSLYRNVSALVADAAQDQDFKQVPEFAPIRHAGHAAGEFFFYPRDL